MEPVAAKHDARPRAIRKVTADDDLHVSRRSKVVGYRAECVCEWRGPRRSSYADARMDCYAHNVSADAHAWVGR